MPLARRLPKRGFRNIFGERYDIVNLRTLAKFESDVVDPGVLYEAGVVTGRRKVKVLAMGELARPVTVRAHKFSAQAKEKIEAVGGKVEVL